MIFLLDENLPFSLIDSLERKGHKAYHIKKLGKTGIVNGEVYSLAIELNAWLITRDKDFRNLKKFYRYDVLGIIVLVTAGKLRVHELVNIISEFLEKHSERLSNKKLIEIEDGMVTETL
jgi:predicted nuclease of predicted toxin-antitoxin system